MTVSPDPAGPDRWVVPAAGTRRRTAVGALLLVLAGGALGSAVTRTVSSDSTQLVAATPTGDRLAPDGAVAPPPGFGAAADAAPAAEHIPPVEVAVPAIRMRSRLIGLRLQPDGALEVPKDYGVAGWYSDGPAPGDTGPPAVVAGHIDSKAGPGIFYRLPEVRKGDAVLVRRSDGVDVRFIVYRTADFPKDNFPASKVYAPTDKPEVRLITCTGTFNKATGHYQSNRVVYARQAGK